MFVHKGKMLKINPPPLFFLFRGMFSGHLHAKNILYKSLQQYLYAARDKKITRFHIFYFIFFKINYLQKKMKGLNFVAE